MGRKSGKGRLRAMLEAISRKPKTKQPTHNFDGRIAGKHVRSNAATTVRTSTPDFYYRPKGYATQNGGRPYKATSVPHWKRKQRSRARAKMASASRRRNR
jgi:hypothetical protein